jgi:hypothetical protein
MSKKAFKENEERKLPDYPFIYKNCPTPMIKGLGY